MQWADSLRKPTRCYWYGFGLCVAIPAAVLALLGWRSVRLERTERERQMFQQQAQLAGLSDSALNNAFERLQQEPSFPPSDAFELHASGTIVSQRDKLLIGEAAGLEIERATSDAATESAIDLAQSEEAQGHTADAITAYEHLRANPKLRLWAGLAIARIELQRHPEALRVWARDGTNSSNADLSPEGFPVALIAAGTVEQLSPNQIAGWCGYLKVTLARLRAGAWWLTLSQRKLQDATLSAAAGQACGGAFGRDRRLDQLGETEAAIREAAPWRRDAQTRISRSLSDEPWLFIIQPIPKDDSWSAAAYHGKQLTDLLGQTLTPVFQMLPYQLAIREQATGRRVWGNLIKSGNGIPLRNLSGWELFVGEPSAPNEALRQSSSYALIILLILVLLFGIGITVRGIRSESELGRLQSMLAAGVTHEFKSPITSIQLLVERIGRGRVFSQSALNEYCGAIAREAGRLEFLVNRLLQTHKIEAGESRYHTAPHCLYEVVKSGVAHFEAQAEARKIHLAVDADDTTREVEVDRTAIQDSIQNLVDNAIKYSGDGSRIDVRIRHAAEQVEITVKDEGIGIEASELSPIFARFYRGKRGVEQSPRGTGLGLWLVKAVAEGHGGRVTVNSLPGKGSEFHLILPIREANGCLES